MKKLLDYARSYISSMGLWDMALLKLCLLSFGALVGLFVPKRYKKPVLIGSIGLFAATYFPLMARFIQSMAALKKADEETKRLYMED